MSAVPSTSASILRLDVFLFFPAIGLPVFIPSFTVPPLPFVSLAGDASQAWLFLKKHGLLCPSFSGLNLFFVKFGSAVDGGHIRVETAFQWLRASLTLSPDVCLSEFGCSPIKRIPWTFWRVRGLAKLPEPASAVPLSPFASRCVHFLEDHERFFPYLAAPTFSLQNSSLRVFRPTTIEAKTSFHEGLFFVFPRHC